MKSKHKGSKGVITVLVSLLLVGVLSIGSLTIEAGRYQAAKTQLAESNISASTSMIAAYDSKLYARYGLLAIDTERFTPERATDYLNFNADQAAGYRGNRLSRLYVVDSVEMTGLYNLTYPAVLKRQILSRAKYHVVPQNYALNANNADAFLEDLKTKCQYVQDKLALVAEYDAEVGSIEDVPVEVRNALTALYLTYAMLQNYDDALDVTLSDASVNLLPSTTGTVESDVPAEDIWDINVALNNATALLGSAGTVLDYQNGNATYEEWLVGMDDLFESVPDIRGDLKDISTVDNMFHYATETGKYVSFIAGCLEDVFDMQKDENLLLDTYIVEYFSCRNNKISTYSAPAKGTSTNGNMENATFVAACVEYIMGGCESEQDNQAFVYDFVQGISLINNLYNVFSESDWLNTNSMYSVAAHIAWANYESIIDTELMVNYNQAIPFHKTASILPVNNANAVAAAFATQDMEDALVALGIYDGTAFKIPGDNPFTYKDFLLMGLWFIPNDEKLLRVADLIQLETRYREQYVEKIAPTFMMAEQNTYCRIKCVGKFSAVLPMLSLDSGESARGIAFQSIKYAGY